jgi:tetratricopeptide (TPR) repeat protein
LAGDKKAYDRAVQEGLDFAWAGKWAKAVVSYRKALAHNASDPSLYCHLGLAYLELERFPEALEAYGQASRLSPEDPAPLARIAEIHQRLGQPHAAADALFSASQVHGRSLAWTQAIDALQRALDLQPEHARSRLALAEIFRKLEQPKRAAKEYLSLARVLQRQGHREKALSHCQKALELEPGNAEAHALADALQRGTPEPEIHIPATENGASPADLARDRALEELAGIPFEDGPTELAVDGAAAGGVAVSDDKPARAAPSRPQIDALVAQAIDFQTRGYIDEAIASYTQAIEAGVDRPAAHFNLGLLYQQKLRLEPAVEEFKQAVIHPQYGLGSHFALGECYKALGRIDEALEHFLEVLKIVDLGTVQREQADDLMQLYDALADSFIAKGDRDRALAFANSLVEFLSAKGWEDKAREARRRLNSMSEEGVTISLAEVLAAPDAEAVLAAMSLSQEYVRRGALTAATEVCYRAIEAAPTYLPLHLRLAGIFFKGGRVEDAVDKYQGVADLYLVRHEKRQAIGVYKRMLRLIPTEVGARSRLIDLLISSGEIDEALEQYLALADGYYQMAQTDRSLEKYGEALRLVPRASDEKAWRTRLLRKMADIQMRRANWREAAELFRQLVAVAPEDERARLQLIDLNYKLGRGKEADVQTVALVDYYRQQGAMDRALALLQEAVRLQPQQMALRARVARAYIDAGLPEQAIAELDTLGELQLDAGLREQAIATVRFIISLKPKNLEAYRQLLTQL